MVLGDMGDKWVTYLTRSGDSLSTFNSKCLRGDLRQLSSSELVSDRVVR